MDLVKTHFLLAEQKEQEIRKKDRRQALSGLHGDGSFWDGANLMGILNTIGGTWTQIEQAKNGKPVYVQNASGGQQNIAPELLAKLEQQAAANQTSVENLMRVMELQFKNQSPPKKDNTLLYLGIGTAGVIAFGTIIYLISKK
ncbi:hypothetical protein EV195_11245 [Tenacibaculum skagerrakense]|uniref:Uncharacterized protein n=1 Tax=Tenacibaculum skagerrakense TaxID=186571 RepID=A0A4V2SL84_9FLAO|nr:hypothetical protein [Tenacibaculum skagerrakense]TCP22396.1 hypothetical protein EV195_11245 [Tenacibaculum skagerrakense]